MSEAVLEERVGVLEERVDQAEANLLRLGNQWEVVQFRPFVQAHMIEKIGETLSDHNRQFLQIERRFEQIDRRFEQIDRRFESVDEQLAELRLGMSNLAGMLTILIERDGGES